VAQELVVAPAQQELSELERFRAELRVALGHQSGWSGPARPSPPRHPPARMAAR